MASFFDHQERAQSRTGWLVILFLMGSLGITTCVTVVMAMVIPDSIPLAIGVSVLLIGVPFLFKLATLGSSGSQVALAMGGELVSPETGDPAERKVLNVVEEMAIASGMPIPPVYILDEPCINAFAAGTSPQNAVIGVSRGAIHTLSRDELQGVMAHEFSHIFQGDMKINMRAIAAIFGLMALGYVGYYILRGGSMGRRGKGAGQIALVGLAFLVLGSIGTLFARLMQAAISRQREFLADASAVQYTRDPNGIGGALMKIQAQAIGTMAHPEASQFNHMLFTEGVQSMFASHPPTSERISRIQAMAGGMLRVPVDATPARIPPLSRVGAVAPETLAQVHGGLMALGPASLDRAHSTQGSWVILMAMLLSRDTARRGDQLSLIEAANHALAQEVRLCASEDAVKGVRDRLALVDIASATLVRQGAPAYAANRALLATLLRFDGRIDLFEWVVTEILRARVELPIAARQRKPAERSRSLKYAIEPAQQVLGMIALLGNPDEASASAALAAGCAAAGLPVAQLPPADERTLDAIVADLGALESLRPAAAAQLLQGALACVSHDAATTQQEYLLLRALSERLAVPLPPVFVQ